MTRTLEAKLTWDYKCGYMFRIAALLFAAFAGISVLAQEPARRIGAIDFYGYAGLNLDQIRAALPLHVGDQFPGPVETTEVITKAVTSVIGHPPGRRRISVLRRSRQLHDLRRSTRRFDEGDKIQSHT